MYTLEKLPTESQIQDFLQLWEHLCNRSTKRHLDALFAMRRKVAEAQAKIQEEKNVTLSDKIRRMLGIVQEKLIKEKAQLLALERANPYVQPRMILSVPRVKAIEFSQHMLTVHTDCLYGSVRPNSNRWHRIGRFEIDFERPKDKVYPFIGVRWRNIDGGHPMHRNDVNVPAPQVSREGFSTCYGGVATKHSNENVGFGRLDGVVGTFIRYTENPLPSSGGEDSMGLFPEVELDEVPEFYRMTRFK